MIRITREAYGNEFRSYKIFIDGVNRGKIKVGETKEYSVENGRHTVRAEIDGYRSNELCVNVENSIIDIEVGTNVKGRKHAQALEYAIYGKNDYLFLRKKKTVSTNIGESETAIENSEMEQLNNADSFGDSQEVKNIENALEKMQRPARNSVIAMVALAGINVFLGLALSFSPALLDRLLFLAVSSVPLFFGLVYLVLSIGLQRRSRVVAIIAVIVHFIDSVLFFMSGLGNVSTVNIALRSVFVLMLLGGLAVTFRYHALKKKYEVTTNNEISALIQESKPSVKKAQIIICAIIGVIGIGTLVYW